MTRDGRLARHQLARHRLAIFVGIAVGAAGVLFPFVTSTGAHDGGCPAEARHNGLRVASGTDVSLTGERRALINKWNEQNRDTPAKLVEISGIADLQRSQMAATQQSHSCEYDVLALDTPLTAEFAEAGAIAPYPLPNGWDTDFLPQLKQSVSWKGTVYALPLNVDVGLLFSATKKTTAPTGLNALLAESASYATQFGDYEGATVNALELIWGFGGDVVHGDQVVVDQPLNRTAIETALRTVRAAAGKAISGSAQSATEASSIQEFADGRATFMRNWPYAFRVLAADPHMRDASGLKFGVSPLPGPTVLGGQNLAISAYSQKKEQAARLIAFLTDHDSENLLFGCGGFAPTRASVYADPRLCTESSDPSEPQIDRSDLVRLGQQIQRALTKARLRPVTPGYQDFSEVFRGCMRTAIFGATDIDYGRFAALLRNAVAGKVSPKARAHPCG